MRKLFLVLILTVFMAGCLATFSTLVKVKDNNGNQYAISITKDEAEHKVATSIAYKNKTYACEVIHYVDEDFNILDLEFDFSSIDATGEGYVRYKSNSYKCSVRNL